MTTAHRPQLEARSGAKGAGYIPTSTEHARLIQGHKKIKYRKVLPNEKDFGIQESKNEDVTRVSGPSDKGKNSIEIQGGDLGASASVTLSSLNQVDEHLMRSKSKHGYEGEVGDNGDHETPLMGLDRIKKEGNSPKVKKEEDDTTDFDSLRLPSNATKALKSWRSDTVFGRSKDRNKHKVVKMDSSRDDKVKGYVNDLTKSDYHREILRKYIK